MYQGKKILLATKHEKERVISPVFERDLECLIEVARDFDTDQFGTFSGEIPRLLSPYDTLIEKGKKAARELNYSYVIASEGSFGPHPSLYFVPSDVELMAFIDLENEWIISEMEISTKTNFAHIDIQKPENYEDFLEKVGFPDHGLIVSGLEPEKKIIEKGIQESERLKLALERAFQESNQVRIETDMRAMMNPTRMEIIEKLANKLARRISHSCPKCNTPGFGKRSRQGNLSCECCGEKTDLHEKNILSCIKCDYQISTEREDGLTKAKAQYCPHCNP